MAYFLQANCFSGEAGECCHRYQGLPGIPRDDGSTSLINSMLAPADFVLFVSGT